MKKKKRVAATASAVALAAVLLFGGTMAYLYDESEEVTNTISPNYNSVSLSETDSDGNTTQSNTYDIVPGTTDTKDPVAKATYTLDSYVYIVMDETASALVDFSIDTSVWTQLDGYTNVWYTLVTTDSKYCNSDLSTGSVNVYQQTLNVLTDKTISYKSTLTNDDMTDDNGNLISDMTIEFQAYIVQATLSDSANPSDPVTAYEVARTGASVYIEDAAYISVEADDETSIPKALADAVSEANKNEEGTTVIVLPEADEDTEDVKLDSKLSVTGDMVIDLNGNNLTLNNSASDTCVVEASEGATLTLTNGSVDTDKSYGVTAYSNSSVSLENMDVSAATYALYVDDANLEATDCTLTAENSRAVLVTTYYEYYQDSNSTAACEVTLTNCEIAATGNSYAAGVQSQGANITLTIDSCDITSNYYGVYQNGAYSPVKIKIVDTTITDTGSGGVYVSNSSTSGRKKQTLIIENSTITGPTAVEFKHTDATITNSTLNATVDPATSGVNGNGSCTNGYSLACTTNRESDFVTGTVVVTDCDMYLVLDGGTSEGHYFVYQVAEGNENSVTIDGTAVGNYDSYANGAAVG